MKKTSVLGIVGSSRNKLASGKIIQIVKQIDTFEDMQEAIYEYGHNKKISNTEAQLIAALFGAKRCQVEIDSMNLNQLLNLEPGENIPEETVEKIKESEGVIFASPVYFGDRSSWLEKIIKGIGGTKQTELPFDGKVTGVVSAGAKRNGGQETTNIFVLMDVLNSGGLAVGNGPPTAQFGGTAWAGDLGTIIDDNFGISTSYGTGSRVAQIARALTLENNYSEKQKILVLVTSVDKDNKFIDWLRGNLCNTDSTVRIIDVTKHTIKPCLACSTCPIETSKEDCLCTVTAKKEENGDEMHLIRKEMLEADGIIIAQLNNGKTDRDLYQLMVERSRHIRRNHFEMSNKPMSVISVTSNLLEIFPLRSMVAFLRHNMVCAGPFYQGLTNQGEIKPIQESISIENFLKRFEHYCQKLSAAKEQKLFDEKNIYVSIGYGRN